MRRRSELVLVALVSSVLTALLVGGGVALAVTIPNNSVNSAKIVDNSVRSADVRNATLTDNDLSRGARTYWAVVHVDAGVPTLVAQQGVVSISDNSIGSFGIVWAVEIDNCAVQASLHGNTPGGPTPGSGTVSTDAFDNLALDGIRVLTRNQAGTLADPATGTGFTVTVNC